MSQHPTPATASTMPATLSAPAAGANVVLPHSEEAIHFGFDITNSTFVRSENDLVVEVEGGGKVTLENFFAVGSEGTLPEFVLADGTRVASADFLKAQSPDLDLSTAAGPAQSSSSSGLGAYDDGAGSLLGGTDRLGSLGTDQWGRSSSQADNNAGLLTVAAATADAGPTPGPVPPVDDRIEYNTRAALYTTGGGKAVEVSLLKGNGEEISASGKNISYDWKLPQGALKYFDVSEVNGKLVFTLTLAGEAALAEGKNLYNYVTITTDQGSYTLQLIVDPKDTFDSATEDASSAGGGKLAEGGLIHGEWHEGAAFTADVNRIDSSGLGDTVTFTKGISASGAGKSNTIDTHTIEGKAGSVSINSGTASAAMNAAGQGTNLIDGSMPTRGSASGTTTVDLASASGMGAKAVAGGNNTIQDVTSVTVNTAGDAMHAESGGKNIFQRIAAAVKLFVTGGDGMDASGADSENKILDAGSVEIKATNSGMRATNGGANTITTREGGDVSVTAAGSGLSKGLEASSSTNTIISGGGITVNSSSTGSTATGLYAYADSGNSASNSLTAAGNITVHTQGTSAFGIDMSSSGTQATLTSEKGSVKLEAVASTGNSYGAFSTGGAIDITAKQNVTITAEAQQAGSTVAYGLHTGKTSTLTAQDGDLTISATGAKAVGVTGDQGKTTLTAEKGTVSIEAHGTEGTVREGINAVAVFSQDWNFGKGEKIISGKNVELTATTTTSGHTYGMFADSATNTVTASEKIGISATNTGSGNAVGMQATNTNSHKGITTGSNTLNAQEVNIAASAASGNATGMAAAKASGGSSLGGVNTVTAESVEITAASDSGMAYGMSATSRGTNAITDSGNVHVQATSGASTAYGMYADGAAGASSNAIKADGTVTVQAIGQGNVYSVAAFNNGGKNSIEADAIRVSAAATNNDASGVFAKGSGARNELAGRDILLSGEVSGTAVKGASAIAATNGGTNTVNATEKLKMTASTDSGWAQTVYADGGTNILKSAGDTEIIAQGKNIVAGMRAINGGSSTLATTAGDVTLTSTNTGTGSGATYGMWAKDSVSGVASANTIQGNGTGAVTIAATGNAATYGMNADNKGTNTITGAGSVSVTATASGQNNDYGMFAISAGANTIKNTTGTVDVTSTNGKGMAASYSGTNTIDGASAATITSRSIGMNAEIAGTNVIQNVTDKVLINSRESTGMFATGAGSSNRIGTDGKGAVGTVGEVEVKGLGHGIQANAGGVNEIANVTGKVTISNRETWLTWAAMNATGATGSNGNDGTLNFIHNAGAVDINGATYGMYTAFGGKNTIADIAGTVSVSATAASGKAMYATGTGSTNTIADAQAVSVEGIGFGMHAVSGGANNILRAGTVDVKATNTGDAFGVQGDGGNTTITATGTVNIIAESATGGASAVESKNSGKTIVETQGDVHMSGTVNSGSGFARAVGAFPNTEIAVSGRNVHLESTNTGTGYAVTLSAGGGKATVNAEGKLDIDATSTGTNTWNRAYGIATDRSGSNATLGGVVTVTAGSLEIDATSGGSEANALWSTQKDSLIDVQVTGDAKFIVSGGTLAAGIWADTQAATKVVANNLVIDSTSQKGESFGVRASNSSTNTIGTATLDITSTNKNGSSFGVNAYSSGINTITTTGITDIKAHGTGSTYGMHAESGGTNTISGGAVSVLANNTAGGTAYALNANANSQNKVTATGQMTIKATTGAGEARGINASNGAPAAGTYNNNVYSGGDLSITAISEKGAAAAVVAQKSGQNLLESAGKIEITAQGVTNMNGVHAGGGTSTAASSNELRAGAGGISITALASGATGSTATYTQGVAIDARTNSGNNSNTIKSVGDVTVTSTNANTNSGASTAYGMIINGASGKANTNTITATNGSIKVGATSGTTAYGVHADTQGQNTLTAAKDIMVTSAANTAWGLYAASSAVNTLNAGSGVAITATGKSGQSMGTYATGGGKNAITSTGNTTIGASGTGEVRGVHSDGGTTSITSTAGNIGVTAANTGSSVAVGVSAVNGKTELSATNGTITVDSTAHGNIAYGMATNNNGQVTFGAQNVHVTATNTAGDAYGLSGSGANGLNTITATDTVDIDAQGTGVVYGVAAYNAGGSNTVTGKNVFIAAESTGNTARALSANSSGSVNTIKGTQVDLQASTTATGFNAQAMGANGQGLNNVMADAVSLTATAGPGTAYSMYAADAGSTNTITVNNNAGAGSGVHITATGNNAYGLYAASDGKNIVNGGNSAIDITASGKIAYAVRNNIGASTSGTNTISTNATDQGANPAVRISAIDTATYSAASSSIAAIGLSSYKGENIVTAQNGTVEVNATSHGGGVAAVWTQYGTNQVNAENVNIQAHTDHVVDTGKVTTSVSHAATGLSAAIGGQNIITVGKSFTMDVSTDSKMDMAVGMDNSASANSANIIQAAAGSAGIEVRITVEAGLGAKAYAMYASQGTNQIIGSAEKDYIDIKGDFYASSGGKNIINTGAGDDRVVLDGAISAGGLTLTMGDGYDVLTLKAASYQEFVSRYSTWLQALMKTGHGIEGIEVIYNDSWSDADKAALHNFFSNSAFEGLEILYPDVLHNGTEVHTDLGNVYHEGNFDGSLPGDGHSSHTFASTQDDVVRVHGDVSHTDITFAGGGRDTLSITGTLADAHVGTDASYTGTLHMEAGGLDNTQLEFAGGTTSLSLHGHVDSASTLAFASGNDTLTIQGDFTGHATMGDGNDLVTLHGSAHGGMVDGGAGNDTIVGDAGNNILGGGAGYDVLTGGAGADTFVWKLGDQGTVDAPSKDVITDFNIAEGDKLDLSQLLSDDAKDNLDNYLSVTHEGANTVLHISTTGESASGQVDQVIVLQNTTLTDEQLMQHVLLSQ